MKSQYYLNQEFTKIGIVGVGLLVLLDIQRKILEDATDLTFDTNKWDQRTYQVPLDPDLKIM